MKQKAFKIFIVIFVVLWGLHFFKDQLIRISVNTVGSKVVGAPVNMGHFSLNLFTQKVRILDFKLYNPEGFPNEPLVDIPEIRVDYDVLAMLRGKLHFKLIVLNLKEMTLVRNREGVLNVDALKVVKESKEAKGTKKRPAEPKEQKKQAELALEIDKMLLNVERVILKDYSKGDGEPAISVYEVALKNKEINNIKSVQQLVVVVLAQAMGPTAIKSAGMYAAATILGVGFLPAGVAGVILSKDDSMKEFSASVDKVYKVSLATVKELGEVKSEDQGKGLIKAKIDGSDITIEVSRNQNKRTELKVSARKMLLAKPEIAGGVLYRIAEKLK